LGTSVDTPGQREEIIPVIGKGKTLNNQGKIAWTRRFDMQ
jgi:hypothetical protein